VGRLVALLLVGLLPAGAFAQAPPTGQNVPPTIPNLQGRPNDFPAPIHPWFGPGYPGQGNYGTVVRYIEVPAQQLTISVYVPGPGSFRGELVPQTVEIPGYVVAETTTGFLYPERFDLRQVTPGVYQWVTLPPFFQPK
jgi:hypothetical protein